MTRRFQRSTSLRRRGSIFFTQLAMIHAIILSVLEKPLVAVKLPLNDLTQSPRTINIGISRAAEKKKTITTTLYAPVKIRSERKSNVIENRTIDNNNITRYDDFSIHDVSVTKVEKNDNAKNLTYKETVLCKRTAAQQKYPNQYAVYRNIEQKSRPRITFVKNENYEQKIQVHEPEYYSSQNYDYDDGYSYSTLPKSFINDENKNVLIDQWQTEYINKNPDYFGHLITLSPVDIPRPTVPTRECNCSPVTRSYLCENPWGSFLDLMSSLGQNIWALLHLFAKSAAPLLIPFIAIKMIIVPIKILKFFTLIKFFLKFFIILPFFLRFVFPALSNSFHFFSQMIQNMIPDPSFLHRPHQLQLHPNVNDAQS